MKTKNANKLGMVEDTTLDNVLEMKSTPAEIQTVTAAEVGTLDAVLTVDPNAALLAEIARLRGENNSLKAKKANSCSIKASAKGAVSVYGLGRFPVTLYQEQWTKLFVIAEEIKAFILDPANKLAVKDKTADKIAA